MHDDIFILLSVFTITAAGTCAVLSLLALWGALS